jgi:hypothetical protein
MHYPFEVKPQESCLTQLYAFPGGSHIDMFVLLGDPNAANTTAGVTVKLTKPI